MIFKDLFEFFSGLLTPVIAVIMVYIAYQQWKTSSQRLRAELYDTKCMVYEILTDTIGEVMQNGDISHEQLHKFSIQRRKSHFLFGRKVVDFLEEVYNKLVYLQTINTVSGDEKTRNAKERADINLNPA